MIIDYSYTKDFEDIFTELQRDPKYAKLADMDGIGKQCDIAAFSKKFFGNKVTADSSVDANANVEDNSIIAYEAEASKPVSRLNAYFLLYKYGSQLFGKETAKAMVKAQFYKDFYINDFHKFSGSPYSYHPHTSVIVRRGEKVMYMTMEQLWKSMESNMTNTGDREYADVEGMEILNDNNEFVELKTVLRHKTDKKLIEIETKNGLGTIVTTDHPVILADGSNVDAMEISKDNTLKESSTILQLNGVVSRSDAYIIGFWLGDGSAGKKSATFHQKDIVESKILNELMTEHSNVSVQECRSATVSTKKFADYLNSLGHLSHERRVPTDILEWNKESIINFLCGIIDAEGTIMPTGSVNIRMNSFALIQQVSELAKAMGLAHVYTRFLGKPQSSKSFKTNREMYKVSFRITPELLDHFVFNSEKVEANYDVISKPIHADGRYETAEVKEIIEYTDDVEYVYDVTTATGDFHCQGMIQHNCFNFSCMDVVVQGLPFVKKIKSEPPQHLSSYMGQMVQFVTYASNSIAGAVGLADFLVCASWFVDKLYDNTDVPKLYLRKQVKQELQSFIYSVNQPFRGGNQSAFTNVSLFDDVFLDKLCEEYVFPDGQHPTKETIKELQCMYIDLYNETLRKTAFTFPVTTACFAVDDDKNIVDDDFLRLVAEKNKEFGFMNIYAGKTSTLSSCCRLRSDQSNEYFNSFGSGGTKIGSASVVTLNLPRMAAKSIGAYEFTNTVRYYAELAAKVNHVKRHIIKKRIDNGNLPLYSLGFMDLSRQYSTCGINGVNEALEILGFDVLTEEGQGLVKRILTAINDINADMAKRFGSPHNMEQTPSENSSIKLAQVDKLLGYNKEYELYSNQFIPLITNADLLDRMKLQGMFDADMTGGAICHLNIDTRIEDTQQIIDLIRHAVKLGVIYHAINYNVQECEHGHITVGKGERCSQCNAPITANYTRVVGFLTNTKNWHKIRREYDYPNRQFYGEV